MGMKPSVWRYCLYSCTKLAQSALCHLSSDGLCSVGDGMPGCTVNVSDAEELPGWLWECWNTELNPKRKQASEYIVGFWVTIPFSVTGGYSGCGWTYCLQLHVKSLEWSTYVRTKCWYPPTSLCGVTTNMTTMDTFKTMKNTQILYRHKRGTHY